MKRWENYRVVLTVQAHIRVKGPKVRQGAFFFFLIITFLKFFHFRNIRKVFFFIYKKKDFVIFFINKKEK